MLTDPTIGGKPRHGCILKPGREEGSIYQLLRENFHRSRNWLGSCRSCVISPRRTHFLHIHGTRLVFRTHGLVAMLVACHIVHQVLRKVEGRVDDPRLGFRRNLRLQGHLATRGADLEPVACLDAFFASLGYWCFVLCAWFLAGCAAFLFYTDGHRLSVFHGFVWFRRSGNLPRPNTKGVNTDGHRLKGFHGFGWGRIMASKRSGRWDRFRRRSWI